MLLLKKRSRHVLVSDERGNDKKWSPSFFLFSWSHVIWPQSQQNWQKLVFFVGFEVWSIAVWNSSFFLSLSHSSFFLSFLFCLYLSLSHYFLILSHSLSLSFFSCYLNWFRTSLYLISLYHSNFFKKLSSIIFLRPIHSPLYFSFSSYFLSFSILAFFEVFSFLPFLFSFFLFDGVRTFVLINVFFLGNGLDDSFKLIFWPLPCLLRTLLVDHQSTSRTHKSLMFDAVLAWKRLCR